MNQPTLRPVPSKDFYEVVRDFELVGFNQEVVVPKFFQYDGASIPPIGWQATYTPFHPDVMAAALVHDWIYYTHQVSRNKADDLLFDLLRANGVGRFKANTMWLAVKTAGEPFWENDKDDVVFLLDLCRRLRGRPNFDKYHFPQEITDQCMSD